ncbi:hypothetical protein P1P75_11800 [Streptomyces sp. ID05-39B]|uniref:hypothetical protein n=1 Tax=Streptomyces sp. ID05-39B TaxID=3028664 RepID=UPI0029A5828B|nr:hypothetical protein [Streptomyces sp. ID05-39B]MDX3527107.1 hypothetical protein [Streptomyces sp. ID05-39B]
MASAIEAPASTTAEGPTSHTQNQVGSLMAGLTDEQFTQLFNLIIEHQGSSLASGPAAQNGHGYTRAEQVDGLRKLRDPFPESEIRYLPRVWCKNCRDAKGTCNRPDHERRQCRKCGQNMTTAHIDLKFVGHAEATNRLLNVDPFWDWKPMTTDANGLPQYDGNRGLWIRLTVCGVTRLGYGNAEGKSGGDAVKEIIGDAIRNAGMRFGMALDLWTSSDLEIIESGGASLDQDAPSTGQGKPATASPEPVETREDAFARLTEQYRNCWGNALALTQIRIEGKKLGLSEDRVQGPPPDNEWTTFDALLETRITELAKQRSDA